MDEWSYLAAEGFFMAILLDGYMAGWLYGCVTYTVVYTNHSLIYGLCNSVRYATI